jgi:MHS family proline/betaine transporter-like MFS transporter
MPAYVMMAACLVGALALRLTPETAGKSLRGIDSPGARPAARVPQP